MELTSLFTVPPHLIGPAPIVRGKREQGFHNLAYIEMMGLSPFDVGDRLAELAYCEREWRKMGFTEDEVSTLWA